MNATPESKGFHDDITVLHALTGLMEKNPDLPRPTVTLNGDTSISWHLRTDYNITTPRYDESGVLIDWDVIHARLKELRRVDLEERMAAIVLALGEDVEWEKNDPSVDSWTYRLSTTWHGCKLSITTWREDVCEQVVVLETEREDEVPDPELLAEVPLVKVTVIDKITEWQCNERLAAVTAPKHTRKIEVVEP